MNEMQIETLIKKGEELINRLKSGEGLFIIDQNKSVRVLFYYKEELFFASNNFFIDIDYPISIYDDLSNICKEISIKFDGSELLNNSKLIKNIRKFIIDNMIDTFVIHINRIHNNVLHAISLEYFNDVLLLNHKGIYNLYYENDTVYKNFLIDGYHIAESYTIKSPSDILNIIMDEYNNTAFNYPHYYDNKLEVSELHFNDIHYEGDSNSILIILNFASNNLISYEKITCTEDYYDINLIKEILLLDKEDNNMIEQINYIIDLAERDCSSSIFSGILN